MRIIHNAVSGTIKQRNQRPRKKGGLKKKDTPILTGYQIYHNYIREHEGLDGKTTAEACGITVKGENKWKT